MKHYWFTILLALTLGGFGAYLYFVEFPEEEAKARRDAKEASVLPFREQDITAVSLRSGTEVVTLERQQPRQWKVVAPLQTQADPRVAEALVRALVLGRVTRVVEQHTTELARFGLEDPLVVLTVTAGSQHMTLSLGDSGPFTSTLYAMRDSDRTVLLTTLAPRDFLNKTLRNFRKRQILDFEYGEVERVRLTYPGREFVLYRVRSNGKDGWRIRDPIQAAADDAEVRSLLFFLQTVKAFGFIDPGPEHQGLSKTLTTPLATVTLRVAGQDQTVELFQPDPSSGQAFARTGLVETIYRVSPVVIKTATKDLFSLRDKRLLGTDVDELAMLEVKTRTEQYVLINEHDVWVLEDRPTGTLNRETVDLFVSRVATLPAELEVSQQASAPGRDGLAEPSAEFTAVDRKGRRHRLALGARTGGLVYAKAEGFPGLYQVRADILDQIPTKGELLDEARPASPPGPTR